MSLHSVKVISVVVELVAKNYATSPVNLNIPRYTVL